MLTALKSLETSRRGQPDGLPRAVIFDRDGVLIKDVGFPYRLDQLQWIDGALALLRELRTAKVMVFVATNQSGVARGMFGISDVEKFNAEMCAQARAAGGLITKIEYCPHLPSGTNAPFNIDCSCRKPKPGMLFSLLRCFNLHPDETLMIGDRESDVVAAAAAGISGARFPGGNLQAFFWGYGK